MKKNLTIFLTIMAVAGIWSCTKEYQAPNEFSDAAVRTSFARDPLNIAINKVASFADLSQGAISRTWTVPAGNVIVGSKDTVSNAETINVQFKMPGLQMIHLVSTFKDSVTIYRKDGSNLRTNVLDTFFSVQVYDSLRVGFTVAKNGVLQTDSVITIEAGESLTFTDTSTGTPDTYNWSFPGGQTTNATSKEATVLYKKVGTYSVTGRVSRTQQFIPAGSASLTKAGMVKVVPSSKPVEYVGFSVIDPNALRVNFSQEVALPAVSEFTVTVDGVAQAISGVQYLNTNDSSIVKLNLAEKVYGGSKIKVTASAAIKGRYGNAMKEAGESEMYNFANNLLSVSEAYLDGATVPSTWDLKLSSGNVASASTEAAHRGERGIFWTNPTLYNFIDLRSPSFNLVQGKTYKIVLFAKTNTAGDVQLAPTLRKIANGSVVANPGIITLTPEWKMYSFTFNNTEPNAATAQFFMRLQGNTANANYLIDDVGLFDITP